MSDEDTPTSTPTDEAEPKVRHIRKQNNVIADQLRAMADSIEKGRTRGLFLVHIDEHRRPDLIVMVEKYSIAELLGMTELELLKLKIDIIMPKDPE